MLALLGVVGSRSLARMNGLKNFAGVCINGVAAIFVAGGRCAGGWRCMMAGSIVGGYVRRAAVAAGEQAWRASSSWSSSAWSWAPFTLVKSM